MNTPFGHYLRIKPQDNKSIFLFAKVRKGSLIQSIYDRIKMFLSATFMLCYVMLCYVFFILISCVIALYKNIQSN